MYIFFSAIFGSIKNTSAPGFGFASFSLLDSDYCETTELNHDPFQNLGQYLVRMKMFACPDH